MFKKYLKIKNFLSGGFTLIEMIVAAFIFGIVATIIGTIFVNSLVMQRRAFNIQQASENANYILESMVKEIRVADITPPADTSCPGLPASTLQIVHPVNGIIVYSLSDNAIHRNVGGQDSVISSNTVQFTRLSFCISGSAIGDDKQPRVTISASVRSTKTQQRVPIDLQVTTSQRFLSN